MAMHSVATKEQVRLLTNHSSAITAMVINPRNKLQLFTASLDGTVKLWDYTAATELRVRLRQVLGQTWVPFVRSFALCVLETRPVARVCLRVERWLELSPCCAPPHTVLY